MSEDLAALEARTRALLASDRVTAPTRKALEARLETCADGPRALEPRQVATLAAVSADLLPLGPLSHRLELARRFDAQLASGPGDGWRYADAPPDAEGMRAGLDALDRAAAPSVFPDLPAERRQGLLAAAREGGLEGVPARWFEDALAGLTRLAYAHPLVQVAIGYDGMADAHGFQDLDAPPR
ncbi:MAG: gluconate 2-dehydrogenase subunit 3 family protein [Caulobacteraceae bacterium]|nr:gluconate 2-dehydrogenase subunit 3 family protein [Caulobacter sp.]